MSKFWTLLLGAAFALSACGPTSIATQHHQITLRRPSIDLATHRTIWMLAYSHFSQVIGNQRVLTLMKRGWIFEPVTPRQEPYPLANVIPTADFHSEALLSTQLSSSQLLDSARAFIYDNERFANTPAPEQLDPGKYDSLAASLALAHHLVSICDFIQPDRLPRSERNPRNEVPSCSIIGLNTVQQSERDPHAYFRVVSKAVQTIRSLEPKALVIAGLSSNPRGAPVTAEELTEDMTVVAGIVNGFWLNVPAPGVGCPMCHLPDPSLMQQALADLPIGFVTR